MSLTIIGFAWKVIVYVFPCALIWLKWLDPSDTAGFVAVQNQAGRGCACVKDLGIILLVVS